MKNESQKEEVISEIPEIVKSENQSAQDIVDDCIQEISRETIENAVEVPTTTSHKTILISATSKVSAQLKDVWYGFTFTETRQINDDSNMEEERQDLWNTVNVEVDNQVQDVMQLIKST